MASGTTDFAMSIAWRPLIGSAKKNPSKDTSGKINVIGGSHA